MNINKHLHVREGCEGVTGIHILIYSHIEIEQQQALSFQFGVNFELILHSPSTHHTWMVEGSLS